jgi:transposase
VGNRSLVAKKYGTNESTIRTWIKIFNNKNYGITNDLTYKKILKENDKLKKLLGEKDLEIAILREINGKKF